MNEILPFALLTGISYLIGAVPFGYLIARSRGVDIFQHGSGNIGATNVGRVLGRRYGILVFLLDFAKGAVPTALAVTCASQLHEALRPAAAGVGAGLAAFLGHCFPIYLRFRGGKGVATATGVVAVLLPGPAFLAFLVWLATLAATRFMVLASLLAAYVLLVARLLLVAEPFSEENRILTGFCVLASLLITLRHRANLVRLWHGNENQLKDTPTMRHLARVLHVLALGLWFGSGVFFSFVAAPLLFATFQHPERSDPAHQQAWIPLLKHFDEQTEKTGTRLAGAAVSPLFPSYFLIQGACGLIAALTALAWSAAAPRDRLHRIRALILLLAFTGVVVGWPLDQKVSALRLARYGTDADLAAAANAAFASWHVVSLLLNMAVVLLVGVALVLVAWLPDARPAAAEAPGAKSDSAAQPQLTA